VSKPVVRRRSVNMTMAADPEEPDMTGTNSFFFLSSGFFSSMLTPRRPFPP
jgi:hypothetical protein